jgi:NitT/TauT family transport system permease protein
VDDFASEPGLSFRQRIGKYLFISLAALISGYIMFTSIQVALGIGSAEWRSFLALTPFLLYSMATDYVRVGIVTLASLGLAVFAGYYLAVHHRAAAAIMPGVQAFAAFPAPAYFPLIFIATLPILENVLPTLYSEVYIFILGFLSCFYYVFFDFWIGVMGIPSEFWDVVDNHELGFFTKMRRVILPASFPYLITGLSSTINSAWAGIAIGEYWPKIDGTHNLIAGVGMMKFIGANLASGNIGAAAWVALLFAVVVVIYGLFFTRNLMDIARKKYVVEEGVFAA